jgi:hypothetical protein
MQFALQRPNYIPEFSRQSGIMKSSFAARREQCEEVAIIRAPAQFFDHFQ